MNTTISFEPENLTVEENLLEEILRAADIVGKVYGVENSELSITLTDDEHIHALKKNFAASTGQPTFYLLRSVKVMSRKLSARTLKF